MKEINYKLFELPTHQVLVEKDFSENEEPMLTITFHQGGVRIAQKLAFAKDKVRDMAFDTFNAEKAQRILTDTLKMIN